MSQLSRPLDFAVVGAAKSGTSSLSALLHQHPSAHIMQPKDGHYFSGVVNEPQWQGPRDDVFNGQIRHALDVYPEQIASLDPSLKVGDASVFYMTDPDALQALKAQLTSDGIVIAVLRRPEERAYSAYMHLVREGLEDGDFAQGLEREERRREDKWQPLWWYKSLGYYAHQVERLHDMFGPERVYVLRYEDVVTRTRETLEPVLERLGLPWVPLELSSYNRSGVPRSRALQTFLSEKNLIKNLGKKLIPLRMWLRIRQRLQNANLQRTQLSPKLAHELITDYSPDLTKLEEITDLDLSNWKTQNIQEAL